VRQGALSRGRLALVLGAAVLAMAGPAGIAAADAPAPRTPPGTAPRPADIAARLWAAYTARGPGYEPRTDRRGDDGAPLYVNRLIFEDSPYLLQHAHNPVDWYAWGPEAFERARREGKPIFLSIGYSTCHWCHVMERESFDDEAVAELLNRSFVSIKVDREQRPEVDEVYMTAALVRGVQGGWPLSSFLTSDGKPFFAGTYFPQDAFMDLLERSADAWERRRSALIDDAERTAAVVTRVTAAAGAAAEVGDKLLAAAAQRALGRWDRRRGGFTPAPKFPREPELLFLLDRSLRAGDGDALTAVAATLDHIARGGIHDQVGGGFHRYATDAEWLVPHFEKMLYTQAQLARAYLEAWRLTGDPLLERVARQTLDFVLRDMTSPDGSFDSATDADSGGAEGAFFVWTPAELRGALPAADAELAIRLFGVTEDGNFEGRNILHLPVPLPDLAAAEEVPLPDLLVRVDRIRARLYAAREERLHPLRDDKIVTAWNAMTITALAAAGETLGEPRYLDGARRAADFLWLHHRRDDGGLWRATLAGEASSPAVQEDYACFAEALVALYDAGGDRTDLERARAVADAMIARFWDAEGGGFYMSEVDPAAPLPARPKGTVDGAAPSGNSVAVRALALLADRLGGDDYRRRAQATLAAFSGGVKRQTGDFAYMLLAAGELLHGAAGPRAHGARGAVTAFATLDAAPGSERGLTVRLDIADGWHVNSDRPLQENLVATRLAAGDATTTLDDVDYPAGERVTLAFQDEPLAVFEGAVAIHGGVAVAADTWPPVARLRLRIQACDDRRCLQPEELALEVPLGARRGTAGAG
jgi:uncharacterized protein